MTPYGTFQACCIEQFLYLNTKTYKSFVWSRKNEFIKIFFLNNAKSNKNIQKSKSQKEIN
jgi:hypothetical protein